jgi:hypothetical protein
MLFDFQKVRSAFHCEHEGKFVLTDGNSIAPLLDKCFVRPPDKTISAVLKPIPPHIRCIISGKYSRQIRKQLKLSA